MTGTLETVSYRAPLVVRASDATSGDPVSDGLVVTAWPAGDPDTGQTATPSPFSTQWGFATLPGLRRQEYAVSPGTAQPTWPAPNPQPFIISVTDTLGRYLPEVMRITAPQPAPVELSLYSTPNRPQPPGWAAVSGEVALAGSGGPAAWALVTLADATTTYATVTDAAGRFRQYLPYPEALPALAGDPPVGTGLTAVTWALTCAVHCQPSELYFPVPGAPPDVLSIRAQAVGQVSSGGSAAASLVATLRLSVPLVLALTVVPT